MSRNNTGNPLGSKAFLDFEDNVKNLDRAVNAEQDTFQDRLGKSRLTWAGVIRSGTGDPSIAVDAAARAEAAASQVQQDAEQIAQDAAQQAVQDVIDGVDGQVAVAENAADRAEAASDAAFINADVYETQGEGRRAVLDGEQYQVVEGDEVVRYKRISETESVRVASYPSSGDGAITSRMRSRLGGLATIMLGESTSPPNIDTTLGSLSIDGRFWLIHGGSRYSFLSGITISFAPLAGRTGIIIYFDTTTEEFVPLNQTAIADAEENYILFATINFTSSEQTAVSGVTISGPATIDGLTFDDYFNKKNGTYFSGVGSSLAVLFPSVDPDPDDIPLVNVDIKNSKLVFNSNFYIVSGSIRDAVPSGVEIDYSGVTGSLLGFFYNTKTKEFFVLDFRFLNTAPLYAVLIAALTLDNSAARLFKSLYISCDYLVNGKPRQLTAVPAKSQFNFAQESMDGIYDAGYLPACDGSDPEGFNHKTVTHVDIYAAYDALMSEHPEYITKTLLGNDQSGVLPIYRYDFKPTTASNEVILPRMVIGTAIHGDGWMHYPEMGDGTGGDPSTSVFSLYYFLRDVCNTWEDSDLLAYLRWNVSFTIIPLQNPWGFNNKSRHNSRNVDVNRNFDYGWENEVSEVKGSAPFSEKESQYIRDVVISDKDIFHFIDYHTIATRARAEEHLQDIRTLNNDFNAVGIANQTIGSVSRLWKGKHTMSNDLDFYGRIVDDNNAVRPITKNWVEGEVGIFSVILESFPATTGKSFDSAPIISMNTEFVGNWILNVVKDFKGRSV